MADLKFRDLLRKQQQMTLDDCIKLLETEKRGVLSVTGDHGYPYGMPMNHFYNQADGKLYFHCGRSGHRVDALKKEPKVSFCVCDQGTKRDSEWSLDFKSVIVFGRIEIVDDLETVVNITTELSRKFTADEEYIQREIASSATRTLLLRMTVDHISGKKVNEA